MISFIVPAHNEQACLGRTLHAIHESADFVGEPYEIILVDDASTDATAEIARQNNAWVVTVNHRQIAATRNSGGRAANGGRLLFVDADTTANPQAVAAALRTMDNGAVGGGAPTWFDAAELTMPLYIRPLSFLARVLPKLLGFTGGAFMFCTRDAFRATGGFNERLFLGWQAWGATDGVIQVWTLSSHWLVQLCNRRDLLPTLSKPYLTWIESPIRVVAWMLGGAGISRAKQL